MAQNLSGRSGPVQGRSGPVGAGQGRSGPVGAGGAGAADRPQETLYTV